MTDSSHLPDAAGAPALPAPRTTPENHAAPAAFTPELFGPEVMEDPMVLFERLRADPLQGQVARVTVMGLDAWLVLGWVENQAVLSTEYRFSRRLDQWTAWTEGRVPPQLHPLVAPQPMCAMLDGPPRHRLRQAVKDSLEPFEGRGIRRHVIRSAKALINTFCESGSTDLVAQFTRQLPMAVMTQVLGMPEAFGPRLLHAARDMHTGSATAQDSNEYLLDTFRDLIARKRRHPGADFTSWLIQHQAALTSRELEEHLRLVLVASTSTTEDLMADTLELLLTDERFRPSMRGATMTLGEAVQQALWNNPAFTLLIGRVATGDTELGGRHIRAGDLVIPCLAAANRDPAAREDITSSVDGNRSHHAFGQGVHRCPGESMAVTIVTQGIDTLYEEVGGVRLAVDGSELRRTSSILTYGLEGLPVTFNAREPIRVFVPRTAPARPAAAGAQGCPAGAHAGVPTGAPSAAAPSRPRHARDSGRDDLNAG
ncbi:cytochrome P450 [Actinacidiphila rubida]|uniref:Cytochrome P450 n=1 Tax=Actinacidiphila rubida TaxID=310780 RepID=A0A1H8NJS2_9ACTN|nr:cytochrome P450 [Actinacidiphila rubida]SEO29855.1 Cytochrome P450 [Actinacidiphila rubida]